MSEDLPDCNAIAEWYQLCERYYTAPTFPDSFIVPNHYQHRSQDRLNAYRVPVQAIARGSYPRGASLTTLEAFEGRYQLVNGEEPPLPEPGTKYQYAFENEQFGYPRKKWDQYYAKSPKTGVPYALNRIAYDAARSLLSIFRERAASGGIVREFHKLYLVELQIIGSTVRPVVIYSRV